MWGFQWGGLWGAENLPSAIYFSGWGFLPDSPPEKGTHKGLWTLDTDGEVRRWRSLGGGHQGSLFPSNKPLTLSPLPSCEPGEWVETNGNRLLFPFQAHWVESDPHWVAGDRCPGPAGGLKALGCDASAASRCSDLFICWGTALVPTWSLKCVSYNRQHHSEGVYSQEWFSFNEMSQVWPNFRYGKNHMWLILWVQRHQFVSEDS